MHLPKQYINSSHWQKHLKINSSCHSGNALEFQAGHKRRAVPDPSELGSVVVPVDEVVQDFQHQLPQLRVLHERGRQQRVQKGGRKCIAYCCGFVS